MRHPLHWLRSGALLPAVLLAVPIGVVAACVTNLFRLSIDYLDTAMLDFPADITVHFAQLDWYWRLLVPALGGLLAGGLLWWDKRQPVEAGDRDYMDAVAEGDGRIRSEEHTSELQSLMRSSYAVFCLKTKKLKYHTVRH